MVDALDSNSSFNVGSSPTRGTRFNMLLRIIYFLFFAFSYTTEEYNKKAEVVFKNYFDGLFLVQTFKYSEAAEKFLRVYIKHTSDILGEKAYVMYIYCLFKMRNFDLFETSIMRFKENYPKSKDMEFIEYLRILLITDFDYIRYDTEIDNLYLLKQNLQYYFDKYDAESIYYKDITNRYARLDDYIISYYLQNAITLESKNILGAAMMYEKIYLVFKDDARYEDYVVYSLIKAMLYYKVLQVVEKYQEISFILNSVFYNSKIFVKNQYIIDNIDKYIYLESSQLHNLISFNVHILKRKFS